MDITNATATVITVNIYRAGATWCYAAWTVDGFDHSDTLGCDDDATEDEARVEATEQFPGATIARVDDVR